MIWMAVRQQDEFDLILWIAQQGADSSPERLLIGWGTRPSINQNPGVGVRTPYQPSCCWHLHGQVFSYSQAGADDLAAGGTIAHRQKRGWQKWKVVEVSEDPRPKLFEGSVLRRAGMLGLEQHGYS